MRKLRVLLLLLLAVLCTHSSLAAPPRRTAADNNYIYHVKAAGSDSATYTNTMYTHAWVNGGSGAWEKIDNGSKDFYDVALLDGFHKFTLKCDDNHSYPTDLTKFGVILKNKKEWPNDVQKSGDIYNTFEDGKYYHADKIGGATANDIHPAYVLKITNNTGSGAPVITVPNGASNLRSSKSQDGKTSVFSWSASDKNTAGSFKVTLGAQEQTVSINPGELKEVTFNPVVETGEKYTISVGTNGWEAAYNIGGLQVQATNSTTWKSVGADGTVTLDGVPAKFQFVNTSLKDGYIAANINAPNFSGDLSADGTVDKKYGSSLDKVNLVTYKLKVVAYLNSGSPEVTWDDIIVPSVTPVNDEYVYNVYTNRVSGDQTVSVTVDSKTEDNVKLTANATTETEVIFNEPDGFFFYIKLENAPKDDNGNEIYNDAYARIHIWGASPNTSWPGIRSQRKDANGYYKFNFRSSGEQSCTNTNYTVFHTENVGQTTDATTTFEKGKYYILKFGSKSDKKYTAFISEYVPLTEYTITATIAQWWNDNVDMSKLTLKVGDGTTMTAVGADNKVKLAAKPTNFAYTGTVEAKANSDYANNKDFINLTLEGDLTGSGTALTAALADPSLTDYTVTIQSYAGAAAPTVNVTNGTVTKTLANPTTTPADNKYTYTFKSNWASVSGTVKVDNYDQRSLSFSNGKATETFADPYKAYTYYFDATYAINNSREAGSIGNEVSTTRTDWHSPVMYYLVDGATASNNVKMTEIATGIFSATATCLKQVDKIWFECEKDGSGKVDRKTDDVAGPTADYIYAATTHAKADNYSFGITAGEAYSTNHDAAADKKSYTIKVQAFKGKNFAPEVKLYGVAADATIGENSPQLATPKKVTGVDGTNADGKERVIYTYTYTSVDKNVTGPTAKVVFDNVPSQAAITAGQTTVFDFPTLTTEYRLCGDAFGGWGTQTVDGVQQPTDGGMVMTKNATTNAYEVTVEKAEGFDNKNFVIAYYTLEDGVAKTRTPLCVSAAQDVNIDGDVTLSMTATAAEGQELKTPFMHAKANAAAKFTFTPAEGKTDQGELKIDMTADYAVTPKANGTEKFYDLSGLQYQLTKGGNWIDATNGSTSKTKRPVAYQYATKAAKAVSADYSADLAAIATANAGNIAASGDLNYDGKANVTTTMAKPLVYTLKMNSAYGAPTEVTFKVDNQPYENFFNPNGAAAAKSAPARAAVDNKVYTYTLITDKHAETSTAAVSMKVKGYSLTVTDIAAATDLSDPAAATESSATVYTLHDELNICGPSNIANGKLFPGDWDQYATATNNVFMTRDNITYTFTAKSVPAGTYKGEKAGFGLRMKDFTNGKLTWLQGSQDAYKLAPGTPVKTYAENGNTYKNMELDFTLENASDVTFVYVCDRGAATGTLSVYVGEFTPVIRGSKDFVGGLDFSKAAIEVTKKNGGGKVTIAGDAQGVQGLKFEDIESAKFTTGVVVSDIDGNVVDGAIKNFVYATDLNVTVDQTPDANGMATPVKNEWAATVTKGENGTLVFHANRTKGAQYYSFVYHDWCIDHKAPKSVEVKLKDGTVLKAWHTKTPKLFEGELNGTAPVNDNPGAELTANGGQNYDKSYGMVATPPKDAPGADYWFMVMTDLPGVDFQNAVATVTPDRGEASGAIPVHMTFDELPAERVIKHYMNSQFRIYRVGAEVDWRLDQATEYVSNTGLFYVDGLKACDQSATVTVTKDGVPQDVNMEQTAGQGYKFSTIDPRNDYKNGVNDWTNFDKGIFGYCSYDDTQHVHIDKYTGSNAQQVKWGKNEVAKKTGNVTPSVDGTLVIDLRTAKPKNVAQPTEPGYMYMHEGFYRMTTDNKMLFYGSAIVPENTMHIELTKVGLWNIDGCQLLNVTKDGDTYTKQHFWEIVGGFTVDATDETGNAVNLNVTGGLNSNTDTNSKTFVYKHTLAHNNPDLSKNDNFNNDYEFQYWEQSQQQPTIKLPVMKPGKYNITVRLKPVADYVMPANKTFDDICHPLQLTAEIGVPSTKASSNPTATLRKVDLTTPEDATDAHKGNSEHFPVKYTAVNAAQLQVVVNNAEPTVACKYAFKVDNVDVTTVKDGDAYVINMPIDIANKQIKGATVSVIPTYTFDNVDYEGKPATIYTSASDVSSMFVSKFDDVKLGNGTQVVVTGAMVGNAKYYVYSANPVFEVTPTAVANGTEGQTTSTDLYNVGGFDFNIDNISNGVKVDGNTENYTLITDIKDGSFWCQKDETIHRQARMSYVAPNLKGLAGYSHYDGTTWVNTKNNWAEIMMSQTSFGMLIPHYYACSKQYTGANVPKHGGFDATFYTYYPVRNADGTISLVEVPGKTLPVSGDQTGSGVTGVENVTIDADALLDVYTLSGVRVMHNVSREEALQQLQPGVYLIGREKVAVQ